MLRDLRHPGNAAHNLWLGKAKNLGFCLQCRDFCRHRQSCGQLQTLIPLSPFLSLPAAIGNTPAMQAKGIHAAPHSSELFPAMVYQCILTGRSWCLFYWPTVPSEGDSSSSHCTVFIINTQEETLPAIFLNNRVLLSLLLPCKYHYCCSQQPLLYYCHIYQ